MLGTDHQSGCKDLECWLGRQAQERGDMYPCNGCTLLCSRSECHVQSNYTPIIKKLSMKKEEGKKNLLA